MNKEQSDYISPTPVKLREIRQSAEKTLREDEVTIWDEEDGIVKSYYTNITPKLKVPAGGSGKEREIMVIFSSVEAKDQQLLHELFSKTRATVK